MIAVFGLLFSQVAAPALLILCGVMLTISSNVMSFSFHAYQAELYPTRIRALAVGFVYSFSRLSAVFSAFFIAFFLRGIRHGGGVHLHRRQHGDGDAVDRRVRAVGEGPGAGGDLALRAGPYHRLCRRRSPGDAAPVILVRVSACPHPRTGHQFCAMPPRMRSAEITRTTSETDITLSLDLDGTGQAELSTGIGFLDHMLTALARHALFDLMVRRRGRPAYRRPPHHRGYRHRAGAGLRPGDRR